MVRLLELPTEILLEILGRLSALDPRALILCQSTCRLFQQLAIKLPPFKYTPKSINSKARKIHLSLPLKETFWPLFNTSDVYGILSDADRYLADSHMIILHFRYISWARLKPSRIRHLRPEASWRKIPLSTSGPIRRLEVLGLLEIEESQLASYERLETVQEGITMGQYYDFLLSKPVQEKYHLPIWTFYLGKRLRDLDEWVGGSPDYRYHLHRGASETIFEDCDDAAILLIEQFHSCEDHDQGIPPGWQPEPLEEPLKVVFRADGYPNFVPNPRFQGLFG